MHLKAPDGTPMANAFLTVMHKLGMDDINTFGDSTGRVRAERLNERIRTERDSTWHRPARHRVIEQQPRPEAWCGLLRRRAPRRRGPWPRRPRGPWWPRRAVERSPTPAIANAAMADDTAAVRRLVASGANVNVAQGDGMTALHWAAEHGDVKMASELIKAHASVKAVTREGNYTPLHVASRNGNAAVVRALIKAGADVNALTNSGATALHLAAGSGSADAVLALIEKGADVNAKESTHGQTPLIFAAEDDRADAMRVLLKHGADANVSTSRRDLYEQCGARPGSAGEACDARLVMPKGQQPTPDEFRRRSKAAASLNWQR